MERIGTSEWRHRGGKILHRNACSAHDLETVLSGGKTYLVELRGADGAVYGTGCETLLEATEAIDETIAQLHGMERLRRDDLPSAEAWCYKGYFVLHRNACVEAEAKKVFALGGTYCVAGPVHSATNDTPNRLVCPCNTLADARQIVDALVAGMLRMRLHVAPRAEVWHYKGYLVLHRDAGLPKELELFLPAGEPYCVTGPMEAVDSVVLPCNTLEEARKIVDSLRA